MGFYLATWSNVCRHQAITRICKPSPNFCHKVISTYCMFTNLGTILFTKLSSAQSKVNKGLIWLVLFDVDVLDYPAQSSELKPIEHVGDVPKCPTSSRLMIQTVQQSLSSSVEVIITAKGNYSTAGMGCSRST